MDADRRGWAALPALAGEAWVAEPGGAPRGAVVVGAEMFGVTGWIRGVCARLAGRGYVVAAPDLSWRARPRLELGADVEGRAATRLDLDLAVDLYGGWTVWGGLPLAEPVPMCDDRPEGFDPGAAADTWRRVDAVLDRHVAA